MSGTPTPNEELPWRQSVYDELHRLAEAALRRESPGHSLQPTMLVNDAYLYLLKQRNVDVSERSKVLAAGATYIRRLLVDYARHRKAKKRGGEQGRGLALTVSVADGARGMDLIELNDALDALARNSARAARTVELKFFGGLSSEEIAAELGVSPRTVKNDWRFAKAWLYRALGGITQEPGA